MNQYIKISLIALGLAIGGFILGRYTTPAKTIEVIKEVHLNENKQENEHTHQVITEKPDGTKVTETVTDLKTNTQLAVNTIESTKITTIKKKWGAGLVFDTRSKYGILVETRIIDPFILGVIYTRDIEKSDNQVLGVLRFEF